MLASLLGTGWASGVNLYATVLLLGLLGLLVAAWRTIRAGLRRLRERRGHPTTT